MLISILQCTFYCQISSFIVDIKALFAVNSELVSVAPRWMDLGLSLGLDQHVLESLESNYPRDVNRCLTETLARWLQQVRTARSWRAITAALISPSINRVDLAHSIATSHGMCQTSLCILLSFFFLVLLVYSSIYFVGCFPTGIGTPKESESRYPDVSSEQLGKHNSKFAA